MKQFFIKTLKDFGFNEWQTYYSKSMETSVFYNLNFLKNFQEKIESNVLISFYKVDDEIVCALPIFKMNGIYSNVFFKGWDNLTIISIEKGFGFINDFLFELISFCKVLQLSSFTENISFNLKNIGLLREKRFSCPYIDLGSTIDEIKSGLSKTVKKSLSWNLNKFEKEGFNIVLSLSEQLSIDERIQKFDKLLKLHNERANITGITSKFSQEESVEFQKWLLESDNLNSIFFLELFSGSNNLIGSFYGYFNHKQCVHFNSGLSTDNEFRKLSLGLVLLYKLIEIMCEKGMTSVDLLRGTERYKFHWTSNVNQNYDYLLFHPKNRLSAMLFYFKKQSKRFGRRKALSMTLQNILGK